MALSCAQIIAQVLDICKSPGFVTDANQAFLTVLTEMCETYDWEATKVLFLGTLNPGQVSANPNIVAGNGPYNLPTNYLRMEPQTFLYWYTPGIPIPLISFDDQEWDTQIQQIGVASLPRNYITDLSNPVQPVFYVYPPPNASYAYQGRAHVRMPDVGSGLVAATGWAAGAQPPNVSAVVPWFPNTSYLITRTAAELMMVTGDKRLTEFDARAKMQLQKILEMKDDKLPRAQRVTLDRRRFGSAYRDLRETKNIFG